MNIIVVNQIVQEILDIN
uniref:Uncharacterized protein n=1 Tax=Arundo donax TaxID=35708 RepID=A0A0A9AJL3_ARUDO